MAAPPKVVCHPNPCLNGGICKETGVNQDFDCICPNPRFKGRFCDGKQKLNSHLKTIINPFETGLLESTQIPRL